MRAAMLTKQYGDQLIRKAAIVTHVMRISLILDFLRLAWIMALPGSVTLRINLCIGKIKT